LIALEAQNASLRCRVEELECERNRERGKQLDALRSKCVSSVGDLQDQGFTCVGEGDRTVLYESSNAQLHQEKYKKQQQQQQIAHISRLSTALKTLKKTLSAAKLPVELHAWVDRLCVTALRPPSLLGPEETCILSCSKEIV
jgi:hypothetical protein